MVNAHMAGLVEQGKMVGSDEMVGTNLYTTMEPLHPSGGQLTMKKLEQI